MFRVEDRHFPFVLQQIEGGLDEADFERMAVYMERASSQRQRVFLVVDSRTAAVPDAAGRTRLAAMMKQYPPVTAPVIAIFIGSRLLAGVMTALRWTVPADGPERYTTSVDEALRFLTSEGAGELPVGFVKLVRDRCGAPAAEPKG